MRKLLILTLVLMFMVFKSNSLKASGTITVNKTVSGQPFTLTAVITNHACGKNRDGSPLETTYKVTSLNHLMWNIATGKEVDHSKVSITLSKNGQVISGSIGTQGYWYPSTPFEYHTGDKIVVNAHDLIVQSPGKYTAQVTLNQPNGNQCIGLGIRPTGPNEYVFNFTNQITPSIYPNPTTKPTLTPASIPTQPAHDFTTPTPIATKNNDLFKNLILAAKEWLFKLFRSK